MKTDLAELYSITNLLDSASVRGVEPKSNQRLRPAAANKAVMQL
jgi:hypothetical protein